MPRNRSPEEYPELHQTGHILVEKDLNRGVIEGDIGVQIAESGKIWVCINGEAVIRFSPHIRKYCSCMTYGNAGGAPEGDDIDDDCPFHGKEATNEDPVV